MAYQRGVDAGIRQGIRKLEVGNVSSERYLVRQFFVVALFQRTKGIPQRTKMTCGHRAHSGVCAMAKEGQGRRKDLYVRTSAPNSSREVDMGT
jgi:hypothetical protein